MVSYLNQPMSLNNKARGQAGMAHQTLYLDVWLAICLFRTAIFEVNASLKWIFQQSKLLPEWLPAPAVLPGESHGQRSLVGYSSWDCKELDTTEVI